MPDPVRTKLTLIAATAVAFTGGVLLASGLNLTPGGHAAAFLQEAPSRSDVKPVADLSDAFISIAESVTPAVVSIDTEREPRRGGGGDEDSQIPEEFRRMFPGIRPDQNAPQESRGSGFIISPDGYILTNNHVVEGADKIDVVLQDNRHLHATVVGRDPLTDIAVIKVSASGLPTVRLGSSENARIGEWVLAIGNPLDLGTTVTSGIISAKGRGLGIIGQTSGSRWAIEDFIQTDAPINPGNSGGPLVNLRGEVVGVNSAIASRTGFYSGYGFAVPVDLARRISDDLIRYHEVRRPALGVQITEVTPEDAEVFRLERIQGVVAQDFTPSSPAERAGMRQGDVIVAVDGKPIQRVGQFQRVIAGYHPGDQVTLDVIRYGQRRQLKVTLIQAQTDSTRRVAQDDRPAAAPDAEGGKLGVAVGPLTADVARRLGYTTAGGLVVTDVQPYGPGARGGLQEGMRIVAVDGQAVNDVAAFRAAMARKRAGDIVSLQVQAGQQRSILNVRLPE
ncbi:trypsin-like peptidase domain-containing protein [Longimicrobium sp.]|uniref:trypsin-like peptidase domain-containing protein n=1 Tax=Longimicrobium sp. TaxID=2029185 RepID=UPI002CF67B60|nr:trypsin-like peptidase domain-containing protein [Longimicrobium sp.]HSU15750.1 trypsin-like peptidase domain-containing protein [Longimicrobium sp.]